MPILRSRCEERGVGIVAAAAPPISSPSEVSILEVAAFLAKAAFSTGASSRSAAIGEIPVMGERDN